MITISIAAHSDCALDTYNLIKKKLHEKGFPLAIGEHLTIVPWRFVWLVKADLSVIEAMDWKLQTDLDGMIAKCETISPSHLSDLGLIACLNA